jgi:hypothetical protein
MEHGNVQHAASLSSSSIQILSHGTLGGKFGIRHGSVRELCFGSGEQLRSIVEAAETAAVV